MTCFNSREQQTEKEIVQYLENNYAVATSDLAGDAQASEETHDAPESFHDLLERELQELHSAKQAKKRQKSTKNTSTLFSAVPMRQVPCMVFINFNLPSLDPLTLAVDCYNKILSTGKKENLQRSQRLIPIELVCAANIECIQESFLSLLARHQDLVCAADYVPKKRISYECMPSKVSFNVVVQARYNSSVDKANLTSVIANLIHGRWTSFNPGSLKATAQETSNEPSPFKATESQDEPFSKFFVSLTEPKVSFIFQIIKNICGMAIVVDYHQKFKKGNLQLIYDEYVDNNNNNNTNNNNNNEKNNE